MGRKVEETMAHLAVQEARACGVSRVVARLVATERNQPCLDFWRRSGFEEVEPHRFVWPASRDCPRPECVTLA
jgi:predicted enzyme involved in methoxymalonyl-ACP biosynthesis